MITVVRLKFAFRAHSRLFADESKKIRTNAVMIGYLLGNDVPQRG